jgi:hypothetical protein
MPASRAPKLGGMMLICFSLTPAFAKDKPILPPYILQARTVAVIIDPQAGVSLNDPNANQTAQRDVETALLKWGRFTTVMGTEQADLVIVLRKGHKLVDETASDPRQNSRVGSVSRTDDGISIGAQHGPQPSLGNGQPPDGSTTDGNSRAHPQLEAGNTDDSFEVYEGTREGPAHGSPGWRWVRKDALHPHDVPAVDEFRKAIAEAEKQTAQQKTKHP